MNMPRIDWEFYLLKISNRISMLNERNEKNKEEVNNLNNDGYYNL